MNDEWIWIARWEDFQHYQHADGKVPPWTKTYTQLINDATYLELTSHRRGVLHGLWLAFASSRCRLRADTRSLSYRLNLRVTTSDLTSLSDAGLLRICSRERLDELYKAYRDALASRAPARSQEKEEEREEEKEQTDPNRGLDNGPLHDPAVTDFAWDHILKPIPD